LDIVTQAADALKRVFLVKAEEVNEQAKAVKRRRKFTPSTLTQTFVLGFLKKPDASHEDIACMAAASGIEVSAQAVEQRYTDELELFFKLMFQEFTQQIVASEHALASILERFSEVILIDSSSVTLPETQAENYQGCGGTHGRGKAALKLQTELDLRSGSLRCVDVEQGRAPDGASSRQHIDQTAGSLRIADLGYFNIPVLKRIEQSDAFFLTRMQHQVKIYVDGVKHDLVLWLNSQDSGIVDRRIELGLKERFACRLIAYRVPEEMANRRRRKLIAASRSKYGRQPSAASLAACDWEFMVTNLNEEQLSVTEAIVLYRARWQIELLFKRWKSHGLIGQMDGRNDVVRMTKFWIRLCAAMVQHWLTVVAVWSPVLLLSLDKVARQIRDFVREIANQLSQSGDLADVLDRFCQTTRVGCKLNRRRKKPGTFSLLRAPETLDYVLT
jgi:hypothetical protein